MKGIKVTAELSILLSRITGEVILMNKKLRSICLFIIVIICLPMLFIRSNVYGATTPTRFINDLPWAYEVTHNWEITVAEGCVIPHTAFERIDGVEISYNRNRTTMTMANGSKKIVVDLVTKDNIIYGDRQVYVKVNEFRTGVYWLPAEAVCNYFGLTFEIYQYGTAAKDSAIRISDDSSTLTLLDLLNKYNPDIIIPEPDPAEETTNPNSEHNNQPQPEAIPNRLIFLTFEGQLSDYTAEIISILDDYDMKATFFLIGEGLAENVTILRRLVVDNHTIGLHTMTHNENNYIGDINVLVEEFNMENDILYKLTKRKTHLCRAPNGSSSDELYINLIDGEVLYTAGYTVWDWNVNMVGMTLENAVAGIKRNDIPVLRFEMDKATVEVLPSVLEYISGYEQYKVRQITESTEEVNFIGRFK